MLRNYNENDRCGVVELFCRNIERSREYLSHGEIQMGLSVDGENLTEDFEAKWRNYLDRHFAEPKSYIGVYEIDGQIRGFIIFGTEKDSDQEYGVIFDLLLSDSERGSGVGSELFEYAADRFRAMGVVDCYLESGVNNDGAHAFFEKKGFRHVSNIYRLHGL